MGVTALQTLRRPPGDGERSAFRTALVAALVAALLQIPAAAGMANLIGLYQPAKAAAWPATGSAARRPGWCWPAGPTRTARPTWARSRCRAGAAGWRTTRRAATWGWIKFAGMRPPVALPFWSLRVAVLLGALMLLAPGHAAAHAAGAVDRPCCRPGGCAGWWAWASPAGLAVCGGLVGVADGPAALRGQPQHHAVEVLGPGERGHGGLRVPGGYAVLYAVLGAAFVGMLLHARALRRGAGAQGFCGRKSMIAMLAASLGLRPTIPPSGCRWSSCCCCCC